MERGTREWFVSLALAEPWLSGADDYPRPPSNREIFGRVRHWRGYAWIPSVRSALTTRSEENVGAAGYFITRSGTDYLGAFGEFGPGDLHAGTHAPSAPGEQLWRHRLLSPSSGAQGALR